MVQYKQQNFDRNGMAILDILTYPNPRLREVAKPVTVFDKALAKLADDMAETMYEAPGIGLASIQVGAPKRVVVIDVSPDRDQLLVLVNPEITAKQGITESEEGCLSVPDTFALIERAEHVTVTAQNVKGEPLEFEADELLAICIQHEIDHLNGVVFVDYLSRLKQGRIRKKLLKAEPP